MPPYDFDTSRRLFRRPSGKYVSRRETKASIDKLLDFAKRQAAQIAGRYDSGEINISQFNVEMRALLKAGHIVASTVGRGGRNQMTPADWGRVARKIQWQYQYLDQFTRKLSSGTLRIANTAYRAKSYINSIYISYAKSYQEAVKDFIDGGGRLNAENEMLSRLEQHSEEGCEECTADADMGWVPVSEMAELGDRICGDFCRCTILFEDEV